MKELLLIIIAYLIGSIPTALIISKKFFGVDIRDYGSGNMGATNTFRVLGSKYGTVVMILDILKGAIAVALYNFMPYYFNTEHELWRTNFMIGLGLAAVLGHIFPIYANNIYLDRPKQNPGKGLSSFTADIENWKIAIVKLRDAPPSIVFVDEPFSSTSTKYQEGLLLSTLEWLAKRGHRVIVATHNHKAVERLRNAQNDSGVNIEYHNLHSFVDDNEEAQFTYRLTEGEAPSMAVAVARRIGGEALARLFA